MSAVMFQYFLNIFTYDAPYSDELSWDCGNGATQWCKVDAGRSRLVGAAACVARTACSEDMVSVVAAGGW